MRLGSSNVPVAPPAPMLAGRAVAMQAMAQSTAQQAAYASIQQGAPAPPPPSPRGVPIIVEHPIPIMSIQPRQPPQPRGRVMRIRAQSRAPTRIIPIQPRAPLPRPLPPPVRPLTQVNVPKPFSRGASINLESMRSMPELLNEAALVAVFG